MREYLVGVFTGVMRWGLGAALALGLVMMASAQVHQAWAKRYNGPANGLDYGFVVKTDNQGNVYVTGVEAGAGTNDDIVTIKYSANGNQRWVDRYHGIADEYDYSADLAVDNAGNVYLTGWSVGANLTDSDAVTIKYDTNGNRLWVDRYDGPVGSHDFGESLALDDAGNLYVAGESAGNGNEVLLLKYDSNGNRLWERRYPGRGGPGAGNFINLAPDGNLYVSGSAFDSPTGNDYQTLKYTPNGDLLWARRYSSPGYWHDELFAQAVDSDGNVVVTGRFGVNTTSYSVGTLKYDPAGNLLWTALYDSPGFDSGYVIKTDSFGNVFVAGSTQDRFGYEYMSTLKYDPNGNLSWIQQYAVEYFAYSSDLAVGLAIDRAGNAYVGGWSFALLSGYDLATLKYAPDGTLVWERRYNGPANGSDIGGFLHLDRAGNVYVTGGSVGSGTDLDMVTIKYAPSGDVDGGGCTDNADLAQVLSAFGQTGSRPEDLNGDALVDDLDLMIVLLNFGRGC